MITYGSICSGIESATVAWHPLGMKAAWFAEIEPFPSAVLAHHYPQTQNLGDMTRLATMVLAGKIEAPDVLVGGTPCQAFSVAGMREGLADPRGALTIKYVELADANDYVRASRGLPASVVVWENVPGVLSDKGNAFGCFLGALAGEDCELQPSGKKWSDAGCVYGPKRAIAWRILDAQYFGLAQRRRRVFVVASARNGFDPLEVLFERDGVRRDTAPRREAGEESSVSPTLRAGGNSTGGDRPPGTDVDTADSLQVVAFTCKDYGSDVGTLSPTLRAMGHNGSHANAGGQVAVCVTGDITHTLKAEGFDGSEDGTGRGQPIVTTTGDIYASPTKVDATEALHSLRKAVGEEAFTQWGLGVLDSFQSPKILRQDLHGCSIRCEACERESRLDDGTPPCSQACSRRAVCAMREAGRKRRTPQGRQLAEQLPGELGAHLSKLSYAGASAEGFLFSMLKASEGLGILRQALSEIQEVGRPIIDEGKPAQFSAVRRLIPKETERLQGFPDDYTMIPWRNKSSNECPDGPRYKAIGNSKAVPVVRWIGRRLLQEIEKSS